MRSIALLVPMALFLAAVVLALVRRPAPRDVLRDAVWLAGADEVSRAEAETYARYLARHRQHRRWGGLFGVLFALVVGVAWYAEVRVGVGERSPLADPLFCGIAGVIFGALSAETYRLRLPRAVDARAPVSASLAPRPLLPGRTQVLAARMLTAVSLTAGAALLLATSNVGAVVIGALGAVMVLACEATRDAVRHRRRPALSERAIVVDANIRRFASQSVAWLELAAATLVATWMVAAMPAGPAWWSLVSIVIVLGGFVAAIVFLIKAAPRPSRGFRLSSETSGVAPSP